MIGSNINFRADHSVATNFCATSSRLRIQITPLTQESYTLAHTLVGPLDFRVPSNDPSDNRVDPDLKPARQTEFTVGTEYGLTSTLVFSGRYTRKNLDRTIEDVGFIDAAGNENFFIANPGMGIVSQPFAPGLPASPLAERLYNAMEFDWTNVSPITISSTSATPIVV